VENGNVTAAESEICTQHQIGHPDALLLEENITPSLDGCVPDARIEATLGHLSG
jgi:hypothetical protein